MNIITVLTGQIEKGNNIILEDGTIVTNEKIAKTLKKEYVKHILSTDGENVKTFKDFSKERLANVLTTKDLLESVKETLSVTEESEEKESEKDDE